MKTIREMFLNETEQRLLEVLKNTNRAQRLSRQGAAAICGTDRSARRMIQELRLKGYAICSDSRNVGYYLATTEGEIVPFIAEIESRIKELYAIKRAVTKGVQS